MHSAFFISPHCLSPLKNLNSKRQHKLSHGSFCFIPNIKFNPIHTTILCPQCVCSLQWILIWIYSQPSTPSASAYCFDHEINHCLFWMRWTSKRLLGSLLIPNLYCGSLDALTFALRSIVCLWFKSLWNARYLVLCVCLQCLQCVAPSLIPSHAMAASMQTRQCDDSPFSLSFFPLCISAPFCFVTAFCLWYCFCFLSIVYVPSSISFMMVLEVKEGRGQELNVWIPSDFTVSLLM